MATSTRTADALKLLTHTFDKYHESGKGQDAIFEDNVLFNKLKGKAKREGGGNQIVVNVISEKNGTVGSYGRFDDLDQTPQDPFIQARYNWAMYNVSCSFAGIDLDMNKGAERIQNLARDEYKIALMSAADLLNRHLWDVETVTTATGNGGNNIIPLPHYIQGAAAYAGWTASLDVGGIDQSANTEWLNRMKDSAGPGAYLALKKEMINMFHTCARGMGGSPDLIVCNQDTYEMYIAAMQEQIRYAASDKATIGFGAVKFLDKADLVWDYHVPDPVGDGSTTGYNFDHASYSGSTQGAAYFINTKFMDLYISEGKDFAPQGMEKVPGKDAYVNDHLFYGQLVCSNRRKQGVLEDISIAIS